MKALVVFSKFFSVGVIATLIQYGILILLVELFIIQPVTASSLGFAISSAANYWLNYKLTFKSTAKHSAAIKRFSVVASLGLLLNFSLMLVLVDYLQVKYLIAQILSTGIVFIVNYFVHKAWTYRH